MHHPAWGNANMQPTARSLEPLDSHSQIPPLATLPLLGHTGRHVGWRFMSCMYVCLGKAIIRLDFLVAIVPLQVPWCVEQIGATTVDDD